MDFKNTIQISQMIINELAGSAFVHKMQGQLFKSQGFTKLDLIEKIGYQNWLVKQL